MVCGGWAFFMSILISVALEHTMGLRVSEADEEEGLDSSQHDEVIHAVAASDKKVDGPDVVFTPSGFVEPEESA